MQFPRSTLQTAQGNEQAATREGQRERHLICGHPQPSGVRPGKDQREGPDCKGVDPGNSEQSQRTVKHRRRQNCERYRPGKVVVHVHAEDEVGQRDVYDEHWAVNREIDEFADCVSEVRSHGGLQGGDRVGPVIEVKTAMQNTWCKGSDSQCPESDQREHQLPPIEWAIEPQAIGEPCKAHAFQAAPTSSKNVSYSRM